MALIPDSALPAATLPLTGAEVIAVTEGGVTKKTTVGDLNSVIRPANVQSVISAATVTPAYGNDEVVVTAQAAALDLANWSGAPTQAWGIVIRIKDDGTARAITYGTNYRAADGVTLPVTTVVGKTHYLCCIHNATDDKHDVLSVGVVP